MLKDLLLVGISGPIGGLVVWFFGYITSRDKDKSDQRLSDAQAADIVQGAALKLLGPLDTALAQAQAQAQELKVEVKALRAEVRRATEEARKANDEAVAERSRRVAAEAARDRALRERDAALSERDRLRLIHGTG